MTLSLGGRGASAVMAPTLAVVEQVGLLALLAVVEQVPKTASSGVAAPAPEARRKAASTVRPCKPRPETWELVPAPRAAAAGGALSGAGMLCRFLLALELWWAGFGKQEGQTGGCQVSMWRWCLVASIQQLSVW